MSMKRRQRINLVLKSLLAAILIVFAVLPVLWIVAAAFNPSKSLSGARLFPESADLSNFRELLTHDFFPYTTWLLNSFKITLISVTLIVILTCLASYALSRFRFKGRRHLLTAILILNVFPAILGIVALFVMVQQLGEFLPFFGFDSHATLIFIYVAGAMGINVLLMKAYIDSVPVEVDESAIIDGASQWQVFWLIIFPMIRPIVVTVAVLSFFAIYGDFIVAQVLLKSSEKLTVIPGLLLFQTDRFDQDWGVITAGSVMAALPVVLMFIPLQRFVIGGLTAGSVKG